MKIISNQKILTIARLCKKGYNLDHIIKHTGVKSAYSIVAQLRKAGAIVPLPSTKKQSKRDWNVLANKINSI